MVLLHQHTDFLEPQYMLGFHLEATPSLTSRQKLGEISNTQYFFSGEGAAWEMNSSEMKYRLVERHSWLHLVQIIVKEIELIFPFLLINDSLMPVHANMFT